MTNRLKIVEANRPKINDHAKPANTESFVIGHAPSMAAPDVSRIGGKRFGGNAQFGSGNCAPAGRGGQRRRGRSHAALRRNMGGFQRPVKAMRKLQRRIATRYAIEDIVLFL